MTPRRLIVGLLIVNVVLVAAGWAFVRGGARGPGAGVKIGLVFDIGGKNDQSFNTAAWRGLERARAELGVQVDFIEPSEGADRESALRTLAARGEDLVIGVGFIFGPDLERLAEQFPNVRFAGVDYSPSAGFVVPKNLAGLRFREQEGSFLIGAIAASISQSKVVGFVGGMKIPLIRKFEAGYEAGVKYVCPQCTVLSAYAGSEPKAFSDAPLGQELASAQYAKCADVIFHAAGKTGDGVFAAAPCCVVTSMIKRVDVAVFDIIRDTANGKFEGGIHELGLKEDGVGFVADERNRFLLPIDVVKKAKQLGDEIIAGKIQVPAE